MSLTEKVAHRAVREGIRRCLWWSKFLVAQYEAMTIGELREELEISIGRELPAENARLVMLSVSIRRRFRKEGYIVRMPTASWYRKEERQGDPVSTIVDAVRVEEEVEA